MIRGVFFSQIKPNERSQGAVQKVFDEIAAFEKEGYEIHHVNVEPVSTGLRATHLGRAFCAMVPFTYVFSGYRYDRSLDGYDFYYLRFEAADRWLIHMLKMLRKNNPSAKILIEFPNYPNNAWMVMPWCFPLLLKDIMARPEYKKCIDRFVVLDKAYPVIYDVPTLHYTNGIDVSRIPVRKPCNKPDDRMISIVGVATMFPSHGYERLIESMNVYYKGGGDRNVVFHVVGEGPGPELKKYMELVARYGLSEHVVFEGTLYGDRLTECYNKCDLALDDLCGFRIGLEISSSLKSREYLAYGLPIIAACHIDILMDKEFKYLLKLENDDSLIDLRRIIDFYDSIYLDESTEAVIGNIRRFAQNNCSYSSTLRNVFSYIESEQNE